MEDFEKEFILKQADLYLSGLSLREISKSSKQSHVTVRNNLTKRLKEVNIQKYYEVLDKIDSNKVKSINDIVVVERVLKAYELLVNYDYNVKEIAEVLNSTEFTIYRDLTNRLVLLNNLYPDVISREMLERVALVLARHSMENSPMIDKSDRRNVL